MGRMHVQWRSGSEAGMKEAGGHERVREGSTRQASNGG
jgi:hypothetical protein